MIQHNLNMEENSFKFSTHISPYIEKYGFFLSCGLLWKAPVSRANLPVHVHKFSLILKLESWETHIIEHTFVNRKWYEGSSH